MQLNHIFNLKSFTVVLCLGLSYSCSSSKTRSAPLKVYYNPALFHTEISLSDRLSIAQSLSSSNVQVEVLPFEIPFDTRKANFEMYELGKSYSPSIVKVNADFGLVNTYDYIDLAKYSKDIRPIAYFSEEDNDKKNTCAQDAEVIVPAQSPAKTIEDLRDKKIGTIYPDQKNLFAIKAFLIDNKIPSSNITLFTSVKDLKSQLAKGDIDAALDQVYTYLQTDFRQSFFKKETSPELRGSEIKYKVLTKSNYQFPCQLIYVKNNISNDKVLEFLINFREALTKGKLAKFRIGKITTSINPITLKRMTALSTDNLEYYEGTK